MSPAADQLAPLLDLTAFAAGLVGGDPLDPTEPPDPSDLTCITELALRHGLQGSLDAWGASGRAGPVTEALRADWRRRRLAALAHNALALEQLSRLAAALAAGGIPVLALKGAAAVADLYPDLETRELGDLDLAVAADSAEAAVAVLVRLGYEATNPWRSPQEAQTALLGTHLAPFRSPGRLPVELHVHPMGAETPGFTDLAWRRSRPSRIPGLSVPGWMDFVIHTAWHLELHRQVDRPSLKWVADLLAAGSRLMPGDWERLAGDCRALGIWGDVRPILGAMHRTFGVGVAAPAGGALAAEDLAGRRPSSVLRTRRLLRRHRSISRLLPGRAERAAYWLHLLWPGAESLRARYGADGGGHGVRLRHVRTLCHRLLARDG